MHHRVWLKFKFFRIDSDGRTSHVCIVCIAFKCSWTIILQFSLAFRLRIWRKKRCNLKLLNPVELSILQTEAILVSNFLHECHQVVIVWLLIEVETTAILKVTSVLIRTPPTKFSMRIGCLGASQIFEPCRLAPCVSELPRQLALGKIDHDVA